MRNSRSPKSGKTFTRHRSTDRESSGSLGNTLPGTGEEPTIAAGGSLLWNCNWGWLVIASSPAEAYHPGTAVANHRDIEEAVTPVLDTSAIGKRVAFALKRIEQNRAPT